MNRKNTVKKLLNKNGRLNLAVFAALFTVAALVIPSGCGEAFSPPSKFANEVSEGGGGGGADPVVPGSGGRKVSEIKADNPDFDKYNDKPGAPGMRIAALTKLDPIGDDVTTQATLGLWGDNKFHIEGYGSSFNGTFANAGFTDAMILYYDKLMEGEFKISARIRIKRAGGVSTGKGINIGAYSNGDGGIVDGVPKWKDGQGSKGMGLFLRAESAPQFRIYYSTHPDNSTTAGTDAVLTPELKDIKFTKEYVYEVARVKIDPAQPEDAIITYHDGGSGAAAVKKTSKNLMYTYRLMDSKTYRDAVYRNGGSPVASYPVQLPAGAANYFPYGGRWDEDGVFTAGPSANDIAANTPGLRTGIPVDGNRHPVGNGTVEMHPYLRGPVYPGISITGTVVEVSQIKIWTSVEHGGNGMNWDYGDYSDKDNIRPAGGDEPIFKTPDTIPAYVPVNIFTITTAPSKTPSPAYPGPTTGTPPPMDLEYQFAWGSGNTNAQWGGLRNNGYKIDITTTVTPAYADENIHYQLFPIGTPDAAFIDAQGNVAIAGSEELPQYTMQELNGEKAYKKWTISFNKEKIQYESTAVAHFVLIARNLILDEDKNAPDYSLLQTLPEFHFRIEVTRPPSGSAWD